MCWSDSVGRCLPGSACQKRSCGAALPESSRWSLRPLQGYQRKQVWNTHWSDGQFCIRLSGTSQWSCRPVRDLGHIPETEGLHVTMTQLRLQGLDVELKSASGKLVGSWSHVRAYNGILATAVRGGLKLDLRGDPGDMLDLALDELP